MEINEMPWYNRQEILETPEPTNGNLVTRLRSKVSKKVVVAAASTLGVLAATAAVMKSRSNSEETEGVQEDAEIFEFPTTDQVEAN